MIVAIVLLLFIAALFVWASRSGPQKVPERQRPEREEEIDLQDALRPIGGPPPLREYEERE